MFQLKHTPTLLAAPSLVQINNSNTRWNSNEDKQPRVLPRFPLGTDAQSFLSRLAPRYFTVTCLMQMRRFMFIHGESYRPPFIPQASSAHQQSSACITVVLGWPRKGTPEYVIAPFRQAQKVRKL